MYRVLIFASFALAVQAQSLAPTPDVTTESPLSAANIQQHMLMGWSLPVPGTGPRTVRAAPPPLNPAQIQQHLRMGWTLPAAGAGPRQIRAAPPPLGLRPFRAAPRAPPAHRAHGPRNPLQGHNAVRGPVRTPLHSSY